MFTSFESGLIMVNNALIGTAEFEIFSINPSTCAENWRTRLDYPGALLPANRGAAYIIPYSITVASAAAPESSLRFLFYGGVVVLPVIAAYTVGVYWVFRGKVRKGFSRAAGGGT